MCVHVRDEHVDDVSSHVSVADSVLGLGKLCQHNFENNRHVKAFENYASIIGIN